MDVVTVGGGPGGLYASLLLKKARPEWSVTVYERNAEGVTYGWGIVFPERTLSNLADADGPSHEAITEHYSKWEPFDVYRHGVRYRSRGHTFASMLRADLLSVLGERCRDVGVDVRYEAEIEDVESLAEEADLLIGADGIHSRVRESRADAFGADIVEGETRFSWFGTDADFEALSHIFVENDDGIWCAHTYPGKTSTFIVDCDAETWANAGLDEMSEDEYIAYVESAFEEYLDGEELLSDLDRWQRFTTIRNERWYDGNVVLVGDAAHTAHYSIGSGTTLAMEDGIALAEAFDEHGRDVESALAAYEATRKPFTDGLQRSAERSRVHFEDIRRYFDLPGRQFVLHHLTRSGRISYGSLARRDPSFVEAFDEWFASAEPAVGANASVPGAAAADSPREQPWCCRDVTLSNRVVRTLSPTLDARDGRIPASSRAAFRELAGRDPGLALTEPLAVSASGRFSAGSPGLYDDVQADDWHDVVADVDGATTAGAHLVHAGQRAASGPRPFALDAPGPRDDAWAPPRRQSFDHAPGSFDPAVMDDADRARVREAFVAAAERADDAGFDYLQVHAGHGTLLWSFLSSLSNERDDEFGGSVSNRLRYPRDVVAAVRDVWPDGKPLGVTLQATDHAPGGLTLEDAFAAAETLSEVGVDVVAPVAGAHGHEEAPDRVKGLGNYADDVRNETGVSTMATRHATDADEVDTLVATGRADLVTYFG